MTEQDSFEAWAKEQGYDITKFGVLYKSPVTDWAWSGWKARAEKHK